MPISPFDARGDAGAVEPPARPGPTAAKRRWWHEPLIHFVAIGALLFALDHALVARRDDPKTIVIGPEVDAEARALFKSSRGREPDAQELEALRQRWLDNEVLYREGLALQVDRGDAAIRERVIFKALSVVEAGLKAPVADESALRAWFEQHRARYDEPPRFDFQEAVLSGDTSEAGVRAFVERLNKGAPGELDAGLRVFKGRPTANVVQSYGEDFARALETSVPGEWRALRSAEGWRAVQLVALSPGRPASFEALRGVVQHDWIDQTMAEQRTAAVRAMLRGYTVKRGEGAS